MMRSPAEDKRLERMSRLPEIVRITRSYYLTQKKPALLLEDVISKVADSYKSSMGQGNNTSLCMNTANFMDLTSPSSLPPSVQR